jgi:hypothetical protein
MSKELDEKKVAGASYILNFFQEVNRLTHNYAVYLNALNELEYKYGKSSIEKMGDAEKMALTQVVQEVRYGINKSFIQYKSIMIGLKQKEDSAIVDKYKKVLASFVIDRDELQEFVVSLNSVLVKDIIQQLLENSQNLVNTVFQDGSTAE